jgi:hypothetical protein
MRRPGLWPVGRCRTGRPVPSVGGAGMTGVTDGGPAPGLTPNRQGEPPCSPSPPPRPPAAGRPLRPWPGSPPRPSPPLDERGDLQAERRAFWSGADRPLPGEQAALPPQHCGGGDQPVPQPSWQEPGQRGWDRAAGPVQPGRGLARRGAATRCRRTSSLAFASAGERPGRTSQPQSRTKIGGRRDTADHDALRRPWPPLQRTGQAGFWLPQAATPVHAVAWVAGPGATPSAPC